MATVVPGGGQSAANRQHAVPELADRSSGCIKDMTMRVTQNLNQAQFISALNTLEANLAQTQNQISSNLSFSTPSQNPVAAGAVNNYDQTLAQSKQYDTNANSAQTRLSTEDSALSAVQNALQSLRDLALEANSGSLSVQDRSAIATQ